MKKKKIKNLNDAKAALKKSGFGIVKGHKLTDEENKYRLVEVKREFLQAEAKKPPPSYVKRKAAVKAYQPLEKKLKTALGKWGGRGGKIAAFHSEYYTARGAKALLELKADPRAHYEATSIRKKLKFFYLKNGRYVVERDGVIDFKTYKWKQIERLQRKQNREIKIERIAARIGTTPEAVKEVVKRIQAEEKKTVAKFKKSKKFKSMKSAKRRKVTITRRVNAVFGAMTDLLEIHGSPKALKENAGEFKERKINGKWSIRVGNKWVSKSGPDTWTENKAPSKGKKNAASSVRHRNCK